MKTINDKINEKKNQKREPIYESKFSFTDANMSRVRKNPDKKVDRRFDSKIPGLCCLKIFLTKFHSIPHVSID